VGYQHGTLLTLEYLGQIGSLSLPTLYYVNTTFVFKFCENHLNSEKVKGVTHEYEYTCRFTRTCTLVMILDHCTLVVPYVHSGWYVTSSSPLTTSKFTRVSAADFPSLQTSRMPTIQTQTLQQALVSHFHSMVNCNTLMSEPTRSCSTTCVQSTPVNSTFHNCSRKCTYNHKTWFWKLFHVPI